jgi:hypothetical protein
MKIFLALPLFVLLSCTFSANSKKGVFEATFDGSVDSCYVVSQQGSTEKVFVSRQFNILKNTLSDTLVFGFSAILPGYTGTVVYSKSGNTALYFESQSDIDQLPKIDSICFSTYKNKSVSGTLALEYSY